MKKYTNKILIITAIVLVLGMVIGYTIDFQTGYRSGRIKYEEKNPDSTQVIVFDGLDDLEAYADSVETCHGASLQENETDSDN
ncbi:MAG: hypothetical protein K5882_02315 [Bacteroidales bacterium]|nr:hypothetical protein [Bacteroidales bacterium]